MLKAWVASSYPGTKTAIDEYNFGGLEALNGALTRADVLGIFGAYGLDLATLWPQQHGRIRSGELAFAVYRNYGAKSTFGDMALQSTSANQGELSVYGALRTSDQAVTVVVINKTFGTLTSTVALEEVTASGNAKVYQYSGANLAAIVAMPGVAAIRRERGARRARYPTIRFLLGVSRCLWCHNDCRLLTADHECTRAVRRMILRRRRPREDENGAGDQGQSDAEQSDKVT